MARLSFLEHHTLQPGGQGQAKPLCLRNPDYAKMRKKIELSFPDQLDTAKVNAVQLLLTPAEQMNLRSPHSSMQEGSWIAEPHIYADKFE